MKKWLTTKDVAKILEVSEFTVRKWLRNGLIKSTKIGKTYKIYVEDFRKFLRERQIDEKILDDYLKDLQENVE